MPITPPPVVVISELQAERIRVPLLGTAPLIVHKFSEKAKRQMLDAQQGRKSPKVNKDPQADYEASFYRTDSDGYGFPVIAFKAATVGAARFYDKSVTMTALRQSMFFDGELSKVEGQKLATIHGEPHMREDVVRLNKMGSTDLRYRPEFIEWSTEVDVVYVTSQLDRGSVLSLINAGGMGVGVGEWRPERSGDFGTYMVDPGRDIEVLG
jgi:hypothetical protein